MDGWKNTSESLLTDILKGVNLLEIYVSYKPVKFWWGSMLLFSYGLSADSWLD